MDVLLTVQQSIAVLACKLKEVIHIFIA